MPSLYGDEMTTIYIFECTDKYPGHTHREWCFRAINLDYQAASREIGNIVRGYMRWKHSQHKHNGVDSGLEGKWAGHIIGAALGEKIYEREELPR